MAINYIPMVSGTIPYPDLQNGTPMDDYYFDDNNAALLLKINDIVARINNVLSSLTSAVDGDSGADQIRITTVSGMTSTTIQSALEELRSNINDIVSSGVPDGSIGLEKLDFTPLVADTNIQQDDFENITFTYEKTTAPGVSDNYAAGYKLGDEWNDNTNKQYYRCVGDGLWTDQNMVNSTTNTAYGTTNASMDDILQMSMNLSSYMAFCQGTVLNAAFGQNNTRVNGIGLQMAMYAYYQGTSEVSYPFTYLKTKQSLIAALSDVNSFLEILGNDSLYALIQASTYAAGLWTTYTSETEITKKIKALGVNVGTLTTTSQIVQNVGYLTNVATNQNASILLALSPSSTWIVVRESTSILTTLGTNIYTATAMTTSRNAAVIKTALLNSTIVTTTSFTSDNGTWKSIYAGRCIVVGVYGSSGATSSGNFQTLLQTSLGTSTSFSAPDGSWAGYCNWFSVLQGNINYASRTTQVRYIPLP